MSSAWRSFPIVGRATEMAFWSREVRKSEQATENKTGMRRRGGRRLVWSVSMGAGLGMMVVRRRLGREGR